MRKFNITVNGKTYEVEVEEVNATAAPAPKAAPAAAPAPKAAPKTSGTAGTTKVTSPMPGTIVSVKVNAGDAVKSDTVVAVLEAMKMENEIFAGVDGVVASVDVSAGDAVNTGDVLVSIN